MNKRKLLILFIITLVVIVTAAITAKLRAPQVSLEKQVLFPDFDTHINQVHAITIQGNQKIANLELKGKQWVVTNMDNYPALFNRVRAALIGLSELAIVDKKTTNPDLYHELGVEDPDTKGADSVLFTVNENSGKDTVKLIVGHKRQSASDKPGIYVRLADSKQALLVEGKLDISADPVDWINRKLLNMDHSQIKQVTILSPDGKEFTIKKDKKEQTEFTADNSDVNKESAAKIIISRIGTGLEEIRADGVMSTDNFTFPENSFTTTYKTFDGMVVKVKLTQKDKKSYAHFAFSYEPDSTTKPAKPAANANEPTPDALAAQMNTALSGWVYQIPDFKFEAMTSTPESVKQLLLEHGKPE